MSVIAAEPQHGNGHPECVHCHGSSFFWRPSGEPKLCERCNSCCECYHGEPFVSDFDDEPDEFEPYDQ